MDFYEIVKSIGSGSFGQVYLARHKREDRLYVIKRIKIRDMNQKDRENTENEVRLLQKLRHPNIVAYKDSYLDREQYLNIVMTHCEGGDIYQKIRQLKQKNFPESTILDWLAQVSLALFYLHDQKILHRDLKTQNIFLKNGKVRLGDFGIAKVLDSTRDLANTCIGTPYYMSPELFKYKPYSYKSDVWAMGCCLYEMCNLRHAFDAQSIHGLALKIMKGTYPPLTSSYSKALRDIITKMLDINPKVRPTIWEIINKPLVKNRIIIYMLEVFTQQLVDFEDSYQESLWEQADKLQITVIINHYKKQIQQGVQFADIQREIEKGGRGEQKILMQIQEQELMKQKMLRKEQLEQKRLEEEIKKLENKKSRIEDSGSKRDSIQRQKKLVSVEREQPQKKDARQKKDRSFSLERDTPTQQRKNIRMASNVGKGAKKDGRKSSVEDHGSVERVHPPNQQSQYSLSTQTPSIQQSKKTEESDAKTKVLQQKQLKQSEQKQQWEKQYQQISQQNEEQRKMAKMRKDAEYKQSSGMNQVFHKDTQQGYSIEQQRFKNSNSIEVNDQQTEQSYSQIGDELISKKSNDTKPTPNLKIEEKYGMFDSNSDDNGHESDADAQNTIIEVPNEDEYDEDNQDVDENEKKLELYKTKLKEKTYKIQELQQSLQQSKRIKEQQLKAFETGKLSEDMIDIPSDKFVVEEAYDEESGQEIEEREDFEDEPPINKKPELTQQQQRMNDRIKLLKHRCEAGLGSKLFQKGYETIKEKGSSLKGDDMRRILCDLLGDENVGYWQLLDQLLHVENLYKQITS